MNIQGFNIYKNLNQLEKCLLLLAIDEYNKQGWDLDKIKIRQKILDTIPQSRNICILDIYKCMRDFEKKFFNIENKEIQLINFSHFRFDMFIEINQIAKNLFKP